MLLNYKKPIEAGASHQKRYFWLSQNISSQSTSGKVCQKTIYFKEGERFSSSSDRPKRWIPTYSPDAGGGISRTSLDLSFIVLNQPHEDWYSNQLDELKKFENLQFNWDSYGAEAPNSKVFFWTKETLEIMFDRGVNFGKVVPSGEGGLAISFRKGEKYSDIEFLNSGKILAINHESNQKPSIWTISENRNDIEQSLKKILCFLNFSSVF